MTQDIRCAIDALELWVDNLDLTRQRLAGFGFEPVATSVRPAPDEELVGLAAGSVTVLLRRGTTSTSPIARQVARHGDTVGDVGLVSPQVSEIAARARANGLAVSGTSDEPRIDMSGDQTLCHTVRAASVVAPSDRRRSSPFVAVDHIACCLPVGATEAVARAFTAVFDLQRLDVGDGAEVGDDREGMRSVPLGSVSGGLTVVLTEPMSEGSLGQTQRFIDEHAGPGVQHAAVACSDLLEAVEACRSRGVEFLPVPEEYYEQAEARLQYLRLPWDALRRMQILVDVEDGGLLMQLFSRPVTRRETFFFEMIQRAGATGFGANNVRALFAAVQASMSRRRDYSDDRR